MRLSIILAVLCFLSTASQAQFQRYIFSTNYCAYISSTADFQPLGDQNNDGYDDFFIYASIYSRGTIYFGGPIYGRQPVDSRDLQEVIQGSFDFSSVDMNGDGFRDIYAYQNVSTGFPYMVRKSYIFYGGPDIDLTPDLIFTDSLRYTNPGALYELDFNGDGEKELISSYIAGIIPPDSAVRTGYFEFHRLLPEYDPVPFAMFHGDSLTKDHYESLQIGDLNGDGKDDILVQGYYYPGGTSRQLRCYYLIPGNENWDFTPVQAFYQDINTFLNLGLKLVGDTNGDGCDDILIADYLHTYPDSVRYGILFGSIPIDTIPDRGLNNGNTEILMKWTVSEDFNGDGYDDILCRCGSPEDEVLNMWLGGTDSMEKVYQYGYFNDYIIKHIFNVGDVDGDGIQDFLISCRMGNHRYFNVVAGDPSVVGIHNNQTIKTPSDFELFDAYPNPFNPSTTITYSLPMVSDIRIEIIDINGELITSSQSSSLAAGMHEYQWNGTDASDSPAASGIYFCRLTANASDGSIFSHTVKLVLMK